MKRKRSLIAELTIFVTAGVLVMCLILSAVFIFLMRGNSDREIERYVTLTAENLKIRIEGRLKEYSMVMDQIYMGALPLMAQDPPDSRAIQDHFRVMVGVHPDVMLVFGCSYLKWNEPGGFMEYSNGHIPADTYDNTQRGWFGAAVNAAGTEVFTTPMASAYSSISSREGAELAELLFDIS